MIKPKWVNKIMKFFCKLFNKNLEEENIILKKHMCETAKKDKVCDLCCDSCAWKVEENE